MTPHRTILGTVGALYRYPVKSLTGEQLQELDVDGRGGVGDRLWSVRDLDGKLGSGKSTRRFRRMDGLLELTAAYDEDVPVLTFPDGRVLRADDPSVHDALSRHVGSPVTLARDEPVDPRRLRANVVVDTGALRDAPLRDARPAHRRPPWRPRAAPHRHRRQRG